jgi:uncharacterized protein YqeY
MELKIKLEDALKEAMRKNDEISRRTIRMVLSAAKLAQIDKGIILDDSAMSAILQKEVKSRHEAINEAQKANRVDLIEANQAEIGVLESFLPKQLSPEELDELVRTAVQEVQAVSMSDMGKVMKAVMPRVQGRVAGDLISQAVRRILAG